MRAIIVGMNNERVIGLEGGLPWHIPEDLKNFKKLTLGHPVIMGRKTYESLPQNFRPLPNRTNVVVSRSLQEIEGAVVANSIEEAFRIAKDEKVFVIGGASIYEQALPLIDTLLISFVHRDIIGDTFFPEINWEQWEEVEKIEFTDFTFKKFIRLDTSH